MMCSSIPTGGRLALFYAAYFAAVGVHLPYWPVWLEARGLSPAEVGYVLAAAFWPRIVTSIWIPYQADRLGQRRRLMILFAVLTLAGLALFAISRSFWALLILSMLTGASWAAVLPLGEALVLQEARRQALAYGRLRLWGSLTFILAAVGGGWWLEGSGPAPVLAMLLITVAWTLTACILLPEASTTGPSAEPPRLWDLLCRPGFLWFVLGTGLIQVSHAVYYGFATLHWRAAGLGETVIGWLWAEGVIAEVVFFIWAGPVIARLGALRLAALAGLLAVLRWSLTGTSVEPAVLVMAQALHAASFGAVHLAAMHHIRDSIPATLQASAQGVYAALGGALLFGLVTPLAGWLYGGMGGAAFWPMALLALTGTWITWRLAPTH